jgi:hypothetical protein
VVFPRPAIHRLRRKSLLRGILLALAAFAVSLRMAGFPRVDDLHASVWQIVPAIVVCWAMAETARCLGRKWSLYHAGVLILLYTELMILALAVILWVYP